MSTIPPAYVETVSGTIINLCDATYSNLTLEDVFSGLSLIKRFNGRHNEHSNGVTVLQHSYAMYLYAKEVLKKQEDVCITALMHDSHEALVGDVINPVVMLSGEIQQRLADVQGKVFKQFNISFTPDIYKEVKAIDKIALAVEWRLLVSSDESVPLQNGKFYGYDAVSASSTWDYSECLMRARKTNDKDLIRECCLIVYRHIATKLMNNAGA